MKVVFISHSQGNHEKLGILQGEVRVHCGDVCLGFDPPDDELNAIDEWFSEQQFSAILCIGGSHDGPLMRRRKQMQPVFENAVYLHDDAYEYKAYRFYGTP